MQLGKRSERTALPKNIAEQASVTLSPEEQELINKYRSEQTSVVDIPMSESQSQSVELVENVPKKSPEKKKLMIFGGSAIAVVTALAIIFGASGANPSEKPTVVASDTEKPGEDPTASISEIVIEPETNNWYTLDWSKQTPELQRLNDLSLEDFRKEPRDNQLLYWSFLNHVYFDTFVNGEGGAIDGMVYSTIETSSLDDTAQEIIDQAKNKTLIADWAKDEAGNFDSVECRKLLSANVDDINDSINPNDNNNFMIEVHDIAYSKVRQGQEFANIFDRRDLKETGNSRSEVKYYKDGSPYITLTEIKKDGSSHDTAYNFVTFTNFAGEKQSIWLNESNPPK